MSWKITPLYFFSTYILWTKRAHQSQISRLLSGWVKIQQFPHVIFETASQFFLTLHHSSVSWEITLLCCFNWNFIQFRQKKSITVQNCRLSTVHQMCTLIGSYCWKYFRFHVKRYRGVISHDTEEWCKIWRKTDLLFNV